MKLKNTRSAGGAGTVMFSVATKFVGNRNDEHLVISEEGHVIVMDDQGNIERHVLPHGALVHVAPNERVLAGTQLASWCALTTPIIAEKPGVVVFHDCVEGKTVADHKTNLVVIDRSKALFPRLLLAPKHFDVLNWCKATGVLPPGTEIVVRNGYFVEAGDIMAHVPINAIKHGDSADKEIAEADVLDILDAEDDAFAAEMASQLPNETEHDPQLERDNDPAQWDDVDVDDDDDNPDNWEGTPVPVLRPYTEIKP